MSQDFWFGLKKNKSSTETPTPIKLETSTPSTQQTLSPAEVKPQPMTAQTPSGVPPVEASHPSASSIISSLFSPSKPTATPEPTTSTTKLPEQTTTTVTSTPNETEKPVNPLPQIPKEEFDLSPATEEKGLNQMIYGKKGSGKTVLAFSVEGTIACLSLDQQSEIVWREFYNSDSRITVFDAVRYYSEIDPQTKLDSASLTKRYIYDLLEKPIKDLKPDWIVVDGTEILNHIMEMAMRADQGLQPFEGPKNLNVWKVRNMFMNQIHRKATQIAKEGVIYTAYVDIQEVTTASGQSKREEPKWAGDIEYKTRVVIKVENETNRDGRVYYATVESSKVNYIPSSGRKIIGTIDGNGKVDFKGIGVLAKKIIPTGVK